MSETHEHEHADLDAFPGAVTEQETAYAFVVWVDQQGGHVATSAIRGDLLIAPNEGETVLLTPQRPALADDFHRGCSEVLKDVELHQTAERVVHLQTMMAQQMVAQQQRAKGGLLVPDRG